MKRLTIFAKGNLDVRDTLHALRIGGELAWNGINEILRPSGIAARVQHETWTRSDALLEASGTVPLALRERKLSLGAFSAESQFSQSTFKTDADAFVLSIQPDLNTGLMRHRHEGFLFYPAEARSWPASERAWLHDSFDRVGYLNVAASMANFERTIARIRSHHSAPILIYNVSAVVPGDQVHNHENLGEILSTRIRRFNLALIELSQRTGISIIDVDAIVARGGADRMKYDALHLTAAGCNAVAREVVSILDDLGCFHLTGTDT